MPWCRRSSWFSARVFGSDYLCLEPVAGGVWFTMFDEQAHVTPTHEFHPHFPVHLSVDSGVYTGAVWFQLRPRNDGRGVRVTVFADYLSEGLTAEISAAQIHRQSEALCGIGWKRARVSTDPSGKGRTAIGPTVRGEYLRAGLKGRNGAGVVAGRQKGGRAPARRGAAEIGRRHGQPDDPSTMSGADPGVAVLYQGQAQERSGWITPKIPSTHMKI